MFQLRPRLITLGSLLLLLAVACGGGVSSTMNSGTGGALDTTFGTQGFAMTSIAGVDDAVRAVAIQSDGKIVVAGYSNNGTNRDFAVARYTTAGALDPTFNATNAIPGIATVSFGGGNDEAYAVAIQSDGKIVVAGNDYNFGYQRFALARFNTDGTLDSAFDTDGKATLQIENASFGRALAIDANGKILVGGYAMPLTASGTWVFALARFTTAGAPDTTFGINGIRTTAIGSSDDRINAIAIQSTGSIVATGYSIGATFKTFALARYTSAGTLDTSFGSSGITTTPVTIYDNLATGLVIQGGDAILVAGGAYNGTSNDFALARYDSAGLLDTAFGSSGVVTTNWAGNNDGANCLVLQNDGKILLGGSSSTSMAFARYTTSGGLDTSFGTSGKLLADFGTGTSAINAMAVQGNGRVVAGGYFTGTSDTRFGLVRFYP